MSDVRWFAYVDSVGTLYVRRYDSMTYEALRDQDLVERVIGPYDAYDRQKATAIAREKLAAALAKEAR